MSSPTSTDIWKMFMVCTKNIKFYYTILIYYFFLRYHKCSGSLDTCCTDQRSTSTTKRDSVCALYLSTNRAADICARCPGRWFEYVIRWRYVYASHGRIRKPILGWFRLVSFKKLFFTTRFLLNHTSFILPYKFYFKLIKWVFEMINGIIVGVFRHCIDQFTRRILWCNSWSIPALHRLSGRLVDLF